jgi:hypothetical protein
MKVVARPGNIEKTKVMKPAGDRPTPPIESSKAGDDDTRYVSNTGLVIILAGLAAALVLGWLLLNKLVDMSREEDCMLSRNRNCTPGIELRSNPPQ